MKKFFVIALALSISAAHAGSNEALNSCVKKAAANLQVSSDAKETVRNLTDSIKECRESVADQVKSERAAKKAAANKKRIERLQKQLAKLQG